MSNQPAQAFVGELEFLSNDYPCKVNYLGNRFLSATHLYLWLGIPPEASESRDRVLLAQTLEEAKRLASGAPHYAFGSKEEEEFFLQAILNLAVRAKFSNKQLAEKLVNCNSIDDPFWGDCDKTGHNFLVKLLMDIRLENKSKQAIQSLRKSIPVLGEIKRAI